MLINEVFEKLIDNPNEVYESTSQFGYRQEMTMNSGKYFYLKIFDKSGMLVPRGRDGGGFNGNICAVSDWHLKRQAVDFMTAVNSGKKFKPESWGTCNGGEDEFRDLYDNLAMFQGRQALNKCTLNGKWFIE